MLSRLNSFEGLDVLRICKSALALMVILIISCNNGNSDTQLASSTGKNVSGEEVFTPAGYRCVHHIKNEGIKPKVGDQVTYHNLIFKNDTSLVSSTYYLFEPQSAVLPGKDGVPSPPPPDYEAIFLMSPGDSLTVYQKLDTFPPEKLPNGVLPQDVFSYNLKLLSIKPKNIIDKEIAATKAREKTVADSTNALIKKYLAGDLDNEIQTTEKGLKYIIHKEGTGDKVRDGGFAKVHFSGFLTDGTQFDNSWKDAKPYACRIGRGRVIGGWDEGIPLLNVGSQATLFVPYTLAYGEAGKPPTIPSRAELVFYVELVAVY